MTYWICTLMVILGLALADLDYLKGFDDSVLYKIDWPGDRNAVSGWDQAMAVTSHDKEKYFCLLPKTDENDANSGKDYDGPNPMEILTPLFSSSSCTRLVDIYWSYELCHGRHIRQYHDAVDNKDGKPRVTTTEYFLGRWSGRQTLALTAELNRQPFDPPVKKIEGVDVPYFRVDYTNGTICDLTGQPRQASVLYVCISGAKSDVFLVEELSTCRYEIVVTRPELCKHPKYRTKQSAENEIKCVPFEGHPPKPKSLISLEAEIAKNRIHKGIPVSFGDKENVVAMFSVEEYVDDDGATKFKISLQGLEDFPQVAKSLGEVVSAQVPSAADFLTGAFCPTGRSQSGEWEYEFCFENRVVQRKVGGDAADRSAKTTVLGVWNEQAHIAWLRDHPGKKPDPPYSVSYFYGGGDVCSETLRPRQTEVRLKCSDAAGVSLFILEPKPCEYIVGVESSIVCEFIGKLDENGLPENRP